MNQPAANEEDKGVEGIEGVEGTEGAQAR